MDSSACSPRGTGLSLWNLHVVPGRNEEMLRQQNRPTDLDSQGRDDGESPFRSPPPKPRTPIRSDAADGGGWGGANGRNLVVPLPSLPHSRGRPRLPEILLLEAVLRDAIRSFQGSHRGLSRHQFREAYEWIASERRDWPFSFLNVCDLLELDATAMRKLLGVTPEHAGNVSQASRLWLKRASTLPERNAGGDAPFERADRLTRREYGRTVKAEAKE